MLAVARAPATVRTKLLVAFVGFGVLLLGLGVLGLRQLSDANGRVATVSSLAQRQVIYTQLNSDARSVETVLVNRTGVLDGSSRSAPRAVDLIANDQQLLDALGAVGDDLALAARPNFGPSANERQLLAAAQHDYRTLISAEPGLQAIDSKGDLVASAAEIAAVVSPTATDVQFQAQTLFNLVAAERSQLAAANDNAYQASLALFAGAGVMVLLLAALLGFTLHSLLINPIRVVTDGREAVATGDFSGQVTVPNRDELGTLATNVNRMSTRLDHLYRRLDAASKHKSEFLANMSHELRTPLNAIIGFSDVLAERHFGELNEKQADYVEDILTSGRHLLSLINDILDLSKIEAGRMELQFTDVRLGELLNNSVALMRDRAIRQGLSIALDTDSAPLVIQADERRLKQVMFNLLSNAVKFTPRDGHITVSALGDGPQVLVSVADDGEGIAPEDQGRIFQEFEQAGSSNAQEGTGLGLALSRRIVELHGGALTLKSALGAGSIFTFTIPRTQKEPTAIEPAEMVEAL